MYTKAPAYENISIDSNRNNIKKRKCTVLPFEKRWKTVFSNVQKKYSMYTSLKKYIGKLIVVFFFSTSFYLFLFYFLVGSWRKCKVFFTNLDKNALWKTNISITGSHFDFVSILNKAWTYQMVFWGSEALRIFLSHERSIA